MDGKGLDADGYIAREGSLAKVSPEFAPVVSALRAELPAAFPPGRLHSAYLYGSIPRGTAEPGVSDLDVLVALRGEPGDADAAAARALEAGLDARFPQVDGVGAEPVSVATLLSDLERHDLGWMVACLCTPLLGEDLAGQLPRYRPTALLARETNGDLDQLVPQWQDQLARTPGDLKVLGRRVTRRLVRTGFTLVMPRWGGWTSDLAKQADVFGGYYPARAGQMRAAADAARARTADRALLDQLTGDLAPWLAAEYITVHGHKTPRELRTLAGRPRAG
jgi:uncharacterized protein